MNWTPLILSLELAVITTCCLLIIGIPIAAKLAESKSRYKFLIEAVVSLPLVLPPTVLGFYLLIVFSRNHAIGNFFYETFGVQLAFSFEGLVVASVLYSLPFMVQPIQAGLQNLPISLTEAAYTMGKGKRTVLWKVLLPNIKPALLTGVVLSFAHTIGEFGIVLMIGGKIPGETLVASIAVYDEVESLNYAQANFYSGILLMISFVILAITYFINRVFYTSS
ncbi:molybdate ABC transporter permease subunit [Aureispira anguillae]|uniref:Molybdenum transport system permease n=1 Tax=Aureispira anguillae TaxID=2864201 RepID=A0A916DQS4_9BACT|nr:molybdate ABC transporter permease subunit [Aureispira anguillae]BDS09882.1 molybdate ABC transporter permease subunit [Aureispira anguillae]